MIQWWRTLLMRLIARCARSECAASFWFRMSIKMFHIFEPVVAEHNESTAATQH